MPPNLMTLLCRYRYDPLDRLVDSTPSALSTLQRFYLTDRLATEIQGPTQRSIMQYNDQLLAQQQHQGSMTVETSLLATNQQRSVLNVLDTTRSDPLVYTPYGHHPAENGLLNLLGFTGERSDPVTGWYLLGKGYRAFNPVLMRFNSPDSWSPFGEGGLNTYAYCVGDPVNRQDPTGHGWEKVLKAVGRKMPANQLTNASHRPGAKAANALLQPATGMKNLKKVGEGAFSFEDTHKGKPRFNLSAHGAQIPGQEQSLVNIDRASLSPEQLYKKLVNQGVDFSKFDTTRLLICHSANGDSMSFAAQFSKITNTPTKGYVGRVQHKPSIPNIMWEFNNQSTNFIENHPKTSRVLKPGSAEAVGNFEQLASKHKSVRFTP